MLKDAFFHLSHCITNECFKLTIHPTSFNSLKPMARRSFHRLLGFVAAFRDDVVRDLTAEEFPAVGHGQEEEDGGSGKAQGPDGNGKIHGKS